MRAAAAGHPADPAGLAEQERLAVADVVARQRAAGLDVISDGEQTKTGFFAYIGGRLSGFEPRPGRDPLAGFRAEIDSFPEYYEQYLKSAMTGGMAAPAVPLGCTGPVSYTGHERLRRDLDLLRAAVGEAGPDQVFVCAVAPSGVGGNEYYPTETAYLDAVADMVDTLFTIEAGAFSFEAANPRHEHVYHVFESVRPPRDAVLLPGVIRPRTPRRSTRRSCGPSSRRWPRAPAGPPPASGPS